MDECEFVLNTLNQVLVDQEKVLNLAKDYECLCDYLLNNVPTGNATNQIKLLQAKSEGAIKMYKSDMFFLGNMLSDIKSNPEKTELILNKNTEKVASVIKNITNVGDLVGSLTPIITQFQSTIQAYEHAKKYNIFSD
jgi:hypothetical protein